jgi:aminomethyltransferase
VSSLPTIAEKTALYDHHAAAGATFTEFAGWLMPLRYSSELAEHRHVRASAGLFDISHMGQLFVTGPEAGVGLSRVLVGDVHSLEIGRARYSMVCDEAGGVVDDVIVYRIDDATYLLIANAKSVDCRRNSRFMTEHLRGCCSRSKVPDHPR